MNEGFSGVPKKTAETQDGVLASSTLHVLNELQREEAIRQFRNAHPDRVVDLNSPVDRNEVMLEFVSSGGAAAFAEGFKTNYDPDDLHQTLVDIDAPNLGETEH